MTEEALFHAAFAVPPEQRAAYLDEHCPDADARRRLDELLAAAERAGPLDPAGGTAAYVSAPPPAQPGTLFAGRYKPRELLGEGGMGTVYVADQTEPVQRRVALKVIRPGLDAADLLARFEQERQALALMDHPNIAKVFDAGLASVEPLGRRGLDDVGTRRPDDSTPARIPYFAMELIKGVPITRYCDEARLTPRKRLELFVPVCQAVQHAHQKGIIHRDLKPSNVLVGLYDGKPVPKVIDFGVAKAIGPKLTDRSVYTAVGSLVGTLEYMAPEQAELNNLDVDTRADVYSLGVILYELLTGSVPFTRKELQAVGFAEMLRVIKEVEPAKPSTKLSGSGTLPSVAAARGLEPRALTKQLRGDLDWIAMRCLEKERGRRYETANQLALEVQRYLADEPVVAGPPSAVYRMRKFVRRNKGLVAAGTAVLAALVAGMVMLYAGLTAARLGMQRARDAEADALHQRDEATEQRGKARAALDDMLSDESLAFLTTQRKLTPPQRAFLDRVLNHYQGLASYAATDEAGRALVAQARLRVSHIRHALGPATKAETAYRDAVAAFRSLADDFPAVPEYRYGLSQCDYHLANVLDLLGRPREAEASDRAALALYEKLAADNPGAVIYRDGVAHSHLGLGRDLMRQNRLTAAETEYRAAVAAFQTLIAEQPASPRFRHGLASSQQNLGGLLTRLGRANDAEAAYRTAIVSFEKLAADHPELSEPRNNQGLAHVNLGALLAALGRPAEAEASYRAAVDVMERLVADFPGVPDHAITLGTSSLNLAVLIFAHRGQKQAAVELVDKAVAALEPAVRAEPDRPQARQILRNARCARAEFLESLGRHADAVADWERGLELDDGSLRTFILLSRATALVRSGAAARAVTAADELAAAPRLPFGVAYNLGCVYGLAAARLPPAEAEAAAAKALQLLRRAVAAGFRDPAHLSRDDDLTALRRRADFAELLWELADQPIPSRQP